MSEPNPQVTQMPGGGVRFDGPDASVVVTPERRAAPAVSVINAPHEAEGFWKHIPVSWRPWLNMSILGIILGVFLTQWFDTRDERRQERAEARADRAEDREIMRAGIAAQDTRNARLEQKLDVLGSRIEVSAVEMHASRNRMESIAAELKALAEKIMDALRKPVGAIVRALLTTAPEEAPPPRPASHDLASPR